MHGVLQDLRYGVRTLRNRPAFTVVTVVALALGMGANTAIFSIVNAVLLRPLPFRDPGRLLFVWESNPQGDRSGNLVCPSNFLDWREQNLAFSQMAAVQDLAFTLTGRGEPEELPAQRVSAELFPMLGVQPVLGRAFRAEEDQPGQANTVILSHRLWMRRFGGDSRVVGARIVLDQQPVTVVGVMPSSFYVTAEDTQLWAPLALNPSADYRGNTTRNLSVLARLRPGVNPWEAAANMKEVAKRLEIAYPKSNSGWSVMLIGVRDELVREVRTPLAVLLATVGFLLLIACSNVANLLLARAGARRKETAIRTALGASRGRLVRQFLTESILLGGMGGALGILLGFLGVRLVQSLGPRDIPRLQQAALDTNVLAYTLAVSILTGIIFGMAPALHASTPNLAEALQSGGRRSTGERARPVLRSALVVVQMALTVVLLVGAGLLVRTFLGLLAVNPGLNPRNVLTMRVLLASGQNAPPQRAAFFERAVERVGTLPGVVSAGAVDRLPLAGFGFGASFEAEGRTSSTGEKSATLWRAVHPNYFRVIGIPLLLGRQFTHRDTREAPRVIIINDTLARRFFPGQDPLGRRLIFYTREILRGEIVGVVGDVRAEGLSADPWPTVYVPHAQGATRAMTLVIRTMGDPKNLALAAAREIYALNPEQPVAEVRTMEEVLAESRSQPRFNMIVLSLFASLAVILATVGVYGVIAYTVSLRTHEIGLRMALGARRRRILSQVVGHAAVLVVAGVAFGLLAAGALARLMAGLLYGVTPHDTYTYVVIAILLALTGLAASLIPALAAIRVDPLVALRHE